MNPGETLKKLHKETGISQSHVCRKINKDTGNYTRMLNADDMMFSSFLESCKAMGYKVKVVK
jgi:hypothetical protein